MLVLYPGVAQLVAHLTGGQGAAGSSPVTRTTSEQALYRLLFFCKNQSALTPLLLLSAKSHAQLTCSVASALAAVRCRYQLFAGSNPPPKNGVASLLLRLDSREPRYAIRVRGFVYGFILASIMDIFCGVNLSN